MKRLVISGNLVTLNFGPTWPEVDKESYYLKTTTIAGTATIVSDIIKLKKKGDLY